MSVRVEHADCLAAIPRLVAEGVVCDACVTDPPYHLLPTQKRFGAANSAPAQHGRDGAMARLSGGFMGQGWDGGDIAFRPETWATVATILRPGAFLVAFGGTRTHHRLACAIEDAGFVIQDTLMWLFATGFPKRRDHLKPAFEPLVLAYKPGGTRTMQIDECRVGGDGPSPSAARRATGRAPSSCRPGEYGDGHAIQNRIRPEKWLQPIPGEQLGRWPANILHDSSDEVIAAFPQSAGQRAYVGPEQGDKPSVNCYGDFGARPPTPPRGDAGSAARFFKSAAPDNDELLLWRAKTIIAQWNPELANTADNHSVLSKEAVASVLNHAKASLNCDHYHCLEPLTSATPSELRRLCESVIIAILSSGDGCSFVSLPERRFPNGSHVSVAVPSGPIGTMTTTISRWKSDGSAASVTLRCTLNSTEAGVQVSDKRFHFSAKAGPEDRFGSRHPTVKPVDLIAWLIKLVCPPGGVFIDPFAGSGTAAAAAVKTGRNAVLIEREDQWHADILRRLAWLEGEGAHSATARARQPASEPLPLFDRPYDAEADAIGSYNDGMAGRRIKAGEPVPEFILKERTPDA